MEDFQISDCISNANPIKCHSILTAFFKERGMNLEDFEVVKIDYIPDDMPPKKCVCTHLIRNVFTIEYMLPTDQTTQTRFLIGSECIRRFGKKFEDEAKRVKRGYELEKGIIGQCVFCSTGAALRESRFRKHVVNEADFESVSLDKYKSNDHWKNNSFFHQKCFSKWNVDFVRYHDRCLLQRCCQDSSFIQSLKSHVSKGNPLTSKQRNVALRMAR
jgi:hypothetical protein